MKQLSVKTRVTMWYAGFMILMVLFILGFLFSMGKYVMDSGSKNTLIRTVESSLEYMEYDDGRLEIDDDLDYASTGIYLCVFRENGSLLYGRIPISFTEGPAFSDGQLQTHSSDGYTWNIYDSLFHVSGYGNVWVRGVTSFDKIGSTIDTLLKLSAVAMPFLVLIAIMTGYLITKRAFRPIEQITASAERIGKERDLSKRIALGDGTDEIYTLANTFDRMFDRLESAFEHERRFTSDASHELRTPTTVIIAQCEYALEHAKSLEETQEALQTILSQAQKMSSLISQLLTLARADRNHDKLHMEPLDFSELTEVVALQQQDFADEKNITIQTKIEPGLLIHGDETMLMHLLLNLMENGVRYGRTGGNISIHVHKEKEHVILQIADDGIGIPKEEISNIWERFYQVDPARSASKDGSGLGLPMVKWIAEAHGGGVSVESDPGIGTIFTVTFPV